MAENELHLTPQELGTRIGVSVETLWRWRKSGEGPPFVRYTKRGRILYPVSKVEAWERGRMEGGA